MAEALGVAASVVSVLQLSAELLRYLRTASSATKDRTKLILEISSLRGVLETLKDTLTEASTTSWTSTVSSLSHPEGPLALLEASLKEVVRKIGANKPQSSSLDAFANSVIWPFKEREVEKLLKTVERQKSLLSLAFDNDHVALSKAIHADTTAILSRFGAIENAIQDQKVREEYDRASKKAREQSTNAEKLAHWLAPVTFYSKQNDVLRTRLEGTGSWLLNSPEFAAWLDGARRTIFCAGIPGSGKTVLASIAVQYLQSISAVDPSVGLAWIYCDYKQHKVQTLHNLLGSLTEQMIQGLAKTDQAEAWTKVGDLYRRSYRNTSTSSSEILGLLTGALSHYRKVYIIIDALDECDENEQTRDDLLEIMEDLDMNIQLFLTSRDIPRIEASIQNPLRLEIRASQDDIEKYVADRVRKDRYLKKHCESDSNLEGSIKKALRSHSGGMFLLARLHMDLLQRKARRSRWAISEAVTVLPKTLDETYADALARIRSQSQDDIELALHALKWVYFAQEPLNIKDFQYAMVIVPGDTDIHQDRSDEPEYIVSVCAGMIQLDRDAQVIRPVHETAQAFFERQTQHFSGAHSFIAASCLTYLLSEDCYQIPTRYVRQVDLINSAGPIVYRARAWSHLSEKCFAKYVASYTITHIRRSQETELSDLFVHLCLDNATNRAIDMSQCLTWPKLTAFLLSQPDSAANHGSLGNMGPLQFAAFYKLNRLLSVLIERGVDPNGRDYNQHTPLHVAICVSNEEAARILLSAGANVNLASRITKAQLLTTALWSSPLGEARYRGNDSLAWVLISKGAHLSDLDAQVPHSERQNTIESGESTKEEQEALALLPMVNNADMQLTHTGIATFPGGPSRAIYFLSKLTVLNEQSLGKLINVEDKSGMRPMNWALEEGNVQVLQKFLDQGALLNEFRMLEKIHADRYSLNSDVVECFRAILENRPTLELDGADASTLLSLAARYKNPALARLLLRREDKYNGTSLVSYRALLEFIRNGDTKVIETILRRAAKPPTTDTGPPMVWVAAFLGHTEMVKALHNLGADINRAYYGLGTVLGTPLVAATSSGKLDTVRVLVEFGAKLNTVCARLGTAFDVGTALDRRGILEYLSQQGGKSSGSVSIMTKEIYDLTFSKVAGGAG